MLARHLLAAATILLTMTAVLAATFDDQDKPTSASQQDRALLEKAGQHDGLGTYLLTPEERQRYQQIRSQMKPRPSKRYSDPVRVKKQRSFMDELRLWWRDVRNEMIKQSWPGVKESPSVL